MERGISLAKTLGISSVLGSRIAERTIVQCKMIRITGLVLTDSIVDNRSRTGYCKQYC